MPSPFPGMDPWLEAPELFPDLHSTLIAELRAAMVQRLPGMYYTALGTRLYIEESERRIEPDVDLFALDDMFPWSTPSGGGTALATETRSAEPIVVEVESDPITEWTAEIRHSSGDRLVASIEILSPSNKTRGSTGRKLYRQKRSELRRGRVHIVEIDLLREGSPTTLAPLERIRRKFGLFDYHACVTRSYRSMAREVYPIRLDKPLPVIAIPLLKPDADVTVDLQEVFAKSYDIGRFRQRAKYNLPPVPPLSPARLARAQEHLARMNIPPVGQ